MSDDPDRTTSPSDPADPPATPLPPTPGAPPAPRPTGPGRQALLGVIVFGATLLILVGLTTVLGSPPVEPAGTASAPAAGAVASLPPPPSSKPSSPIPSSSQPSSPIPPGAAGSPPASADLPPPADPVLVGAGDIGDCGSDGDEATAALLDDIPGTVFTAGDNAYDDGAARDFQQCYAPSWGRHLARTWPAPGNHDWHTGGLAGYRDYFGAAGAGPDGASWYARDLGTWRVIVLDSNCDEVGGCAADSVQGRWLAAELEASDAACTVAIFHHPRFSSGERYGDDPAMDPFWRALYAGGVDIVVNGHEHSYERFAPQDPDAREDRARGIREFVVGTGGAGLRGFGTTSANSELRASVAHGVLALTLGDGSYDWEFHAAGSDFSDRGTARCH